MRIILFLAAVSTVFATTFVAQPAPVVEEEKLLELKIDKEMTVADLIEQMAAATGHTFEYDAASPRVQQKMGTGFVHSVPQGRVFDTFRAILAFYELTIVPGEANFVVMDSRSTNSFVRSRADELIEATEIHSSPYRYDPTCHPVRPKKTQSP